MDLQNLINVGFSWAKLRICINADSWACERISIDEEHVLIDKEFKCGMCHLLSTIKEIDNDKIHCKCVNCATRVIAEQPKAGHEWITCDCCKVDIQLQKDSWMHNDAICPECSVHYALEPTPANLLVKPQCIHD